MKEKEPLQTDRHFYFLEKRQLAVEKMKTEHY